MVMTKLRLSNRESSRYLDGMGPICKSNKNEVISKSGNILLETLGFRVIFEMS